MMHGPINIRKHSFFNTNWKRSYVCLLWVLPTVCNCNRPVHTVCHSSAKWISTMGFNAVCLRYTSDSWLQTPWCEPVGSCLTGYGPFHCIRYKKTELKWGEKTSCFWATAIQGVFKKRPKFCYKNLSHILKQIVHVLSSADVARRIMLIAKLKKWQLVVKTW